MSTQDKKTPAHTDSATTKNQHTTKPEANAKKESRQTTPTDKKAEIKEVPDTKRTTMSEAKDPTTRKEAK